MILQGDASRDWERFGNEDPYFGVLSDPKFRGTSLDEQARDEFFGSGRTHAETLLETVRETLGEHARGTALDFGCGVGRLTLAFAPFFAKVVGLDIAPGMLAEARRNAARDRVTNVAFHSSLAPEQLVSRSYDLVHSYIALQHIPVATGEPIIAALIDAVAEGGVGALHVTIRPADGARRIALRNWIKRNRLARGAANVAMRRPWNQPAMEMNLYRTERIVEMLARSGIERFTCLRIDDWGSIGLFFLFRRDAGPGGRSPWSNPVRTG